MRCTMLSGALVLLPLLACTPAEEAGSPAAPPPPPPSPPSIAGAQDETTLRATARRLAGLEHDGEWAAHAAALDEIWGQMEENHLTAMRRWQASILAPLVDEPGRVVFYPFGGPNFLNAYTFLPAAPVYVLVGLEPPGPIPQLEGLDGEALQAAAGRLEGSFRNLVKAGYFVRTQMGTDLVAAESLEGLLPMIYIFLARTGHRPVDVRYVVLGEEGEVRDAAEATPGEGSAVRVDFVAEGEEGGAVRSLYYFSQDLSDEGLAGRAAFLRFLRRLGPFNTFMKSGEYLLHMEGFATLRDFLLAESRLVLQDDSGLSHRGLVEAGFETRYFGTYTGVVAAYGPYLQEDLRQAYAGGAEPLPFNIGYHVELEGGCLILARRNGE